MRCEKKSSVENKLLNNIIRGNKQKRGIAKEPLKATKIDG